MSIQTSESLEDEERLRTLWKDIHAHVHAHVRSDLADEIVQEAWLSALRSPPRNPGVHFAWLRVVARNAAARLFRAERQRRAREEDAARLALQRRRSAETEPSEKAEVLRVLDELHSPYREVLSLRYMEGQAIPQISRVLQRPPGTVRSQLTRGLQLMRLSLRDRARRDGKSSLMGWLGLVRWCTTASPLRYLSSTLLVLALALLVTSRLSPGAQAGSKTSIAFRAGPSGSRQGGPTADAGETGSEARTPGVLVDPEWAPVSEPAGAAGAWSRPLHVVVQDAFGGPAAGMPVLVGPADGSSRALAGHTDSTGRFALGSVDPRLWVWSEPDDALPTPRHLIASVQEGAELALCLGPRMVIVKGLVRDAWGTPLEGVKLTSLGRAMRSGTPYVSSQGTLELPPVACTRVLGRNEGLRLIGKTSRRLRWLVEAPGQPPAVFEARALDRTGAFEVTLPPRATVTGRLLEANGAPAVDARLVLELPAPLPAREEHTGSDGSFFFDAVPPGSFVLRRVGGSGVARQAGCARPGEPTWLELRSDPGLDVDGTALRAGQPLRGWEVELVDQDKLPGRRCTTDEGGRFLFEGCGAERVHRLLLHDPSGRIAAWLPEVRAGAGPHVLEVPAPSSKARIVGRLRPHGTDPGAVFVEIEDPLSTRTLLPVEPDGSFAAQDLMPGSWRVRAWIPGLGSAPLGSLRLVEGQVCEADLELPGLARLEVQVELPCRFPPEKARVQVWTSALQGTTSRCARSLVFDPRAGCFRGGFPPGRYETTIQVADFPLHRAFVHLRAGETTVLVGETPEYARVRLLLLPERPFLEGESFALQMESPSTGRSMIPTLGPDVQERLEVVLPADAARIRVLSSYGLVGEWSFAVGSAMEGELTIPLRSATD